MFFNVFLIVAAAAAAAEVVVHVSDSPNDDVPQTCPFPFFWSRLSSSTSSTSSSWIGVCGPQPHASLPTQGNHAKIILPSDSLTSWPGSFLVLLPPGLLPPSFVAEGKQVESVAGSVGTAVWLDKEPHTSSSSLDCLWVLGGRGNVAAWLVSSPYNEQASATALQVPQPAVEPQHIQGSFIIDWVRVLTPLVVYSCWVWLLRKAVFDFDK